VCVCRKFGFLVPQNYADQDLEFGDAELSVLRAFTGINSLNVSCDVLLPGTNPSFKRKSLMFDNKLMRSIQP